MVVNKDSPHRRRSIAVPSQNRPTILPRAKRRAHSIVPGDRMSPLAKARRFLVPRKSILKTFTNTLHAAESSAESSSQPQPQHEPELQPESRRFAADDANATQSMDLTNDFRPMLDDNTTRQSFGGRRVSFAHHVQIRLIDRQNNKNESSQSPPAAESTTGERPPVITDENAYPGAAPNSRRRSSIRHSLAGSECEDMDLTSIDSSAFLHVAGSAIMDEEIAVDDDMEVTEVIRGDFIRKRSLSLGKRHPLAQVSQTTQDHMRSDEQSCSSDDSQTSDDYGVIEYTAPLEKSQSPPAKHDEAWLALRRATHSGDTPIEDDVHHANVDDGMDLRDALQRLEQARKSFPADQPIPNHGEVQSQYAQDDTYSSTEDSFQDEGEGNDQTMNISKVLGQASSDELGYARMSTGSAMDESATYGNIVVPVQTTPRSEIPQQSREPARAPPLNVFQPPSSVSVPEPALAPSSPSRGQRNIPIPFPFTPRPPTSPLKPKKPTAVLSSLKDKPAPTFSAAFAPPVARSTPKKSSVVITSPNKRPRPNEGSDNENADTDKPSPAKRPTVAGKWPFTAPQANDAAPVAPSPKPKPLSPSRKVPFQAPTGSAPRPRPSSSLRRPSGYFARRKSLGAGLGSNTAEQDEAFTANVRSSPKKSGVGTGRASLGPGSADVWNRFEKDSRSQLGHAKAKETEVQQSVREVSRQVVGSPKASPAPASPGPSSTRLISPIRSPSSPVLTVDISTLIGPEEFGDGDVVEQTDLNPTEQWREGVEPSEFVDDDGPPISIEQFFVMTKVKFMDELTAPRRSTHPSQQPIRQARNPDDIPLSDYVTAMGMDVPQLILFSRVSKDLQAWVEKSKADFAQAEDEAAKITPELFTEYSRADEEGRAELLHQLQLIRVNTRALAKSDWYDWKLQWLEGLRITAEKTFTSLEADAKVLEDIMAIADEVIPTLQQEYDEIMQDLEKETAEVAEIEASDQDYLNELKASIAEQNIEVEALRAEVAEGHTQLLFLEEKLEELDAQKGEASTAIADAQRIMHIQKNSTQAEVYKLAQELEGLEDLHMFRTTKVNADLFEYVYASQLRVSIPCRKFIPIVARLEVTRLEKTRSRFKDDFPRLSDFLLRMAKQQVIHKKNFVVREIVQRLSDYWSSCSQLRSQLKLIAIKYPVEIEILRLLDKEPSAFKAKVMVLFPTVKAKAFVSFVFTTKTFCYWPMSIDSLQYDVEVAYGPIEAGPILKAVTERLQQASLEDNYACLLDACIEAQDVYR